MSDLLKEIKRPFKQVDKFIRKELGGYGTAILTGIQSKRIDKFIRKELGGYDTAILAGIQALTGNYPGAALTLAGGALGNGQYALPAFLLSGGLGNLGAITSGLGSGVGGGLGSAINAGGNWLANTGLGGLNILPASLGGGGLSSLSGIGLGGLAGKGIAAGGIAGGGGGGIGGLFGSNSLVPLGLGLYAASSAGKPSTAYQESTSTPIRPQYSPQEQSLRDYLMIRAQQNMNTQPSLLSQRINNIYGRGGM